MTGIWISPRTFHRFAAAAEVETPDRKALLEEVATRAAAGGELADMVGVMPDPDPVLRKRGDDADVLEELTADDQITMAMQQRKLGTLEKGDYQLAAGSRQEEEPDARAEALRDALWEDMESMDLYNINSQVLDAPFFGYSPCELIWEADGPRLRLANVKPRPWSWFGFDADGLLVFRSEANPDGEPCHPLKFVCARHFPTAKNPYGTRLLSRCLWPVAFKRGGIQWWVRFTERFGQPWLVGKAWPGATKKDREEMLGQLLQMASSATAVLSAGAEMDVHESTGKSAEIHRDFVRFWDAAISKIIMGQTLTADLADVGARAASETHYSVLDDFRAADERIVATFWNDVAWAYAQVNDAQALSPTWEWNEPEDRAELAEQAKRLVEAGVTFRKEYFIRRFDLAEDEFETGGVVADAGDSEEDGVPAVQDVQQTALNGAQIKSLLGLIESVGTGAISKDSAKAVIRVSFPGIDPSAAAAMIDPIQIKAQPAAAQGGAAAFAAPAASDATAEQRQDAIDAMLSDLMPEATEAAEARNQTIFNLVANASSFEQIQAALPDLLPEMASGDMATLLQRALLAADLYGRLTVTEEAEDADAD